MPSMWGWENRAGWYRYTVSLARLPTSGELGRLRWRKLNGDTLSLDDIYVGQECLKQCSLHGDCRVCSNVYVCYTNVFMDMSYVENCYSQNTVHGKILAGKIYSEL